MADRATGKLRCGEDPQRRSATGPRRGHDRAAVQSPGHSRCNKCFGTAPTQAAVKKELPEIV